VVKTYAESKDYADFERGITNQRGDQHVYTPSMRALTGIVHALRPREESEEGEELGLDD
jgi:hypothetical protein